MYARGGDDIVRGLAGDDELSGDGGNDTLFGDAGADLLKGGLGADRMVGGADDDTYTVDDVGDVLVERAGGGYDRVVAALDWTLRSELEHLSLSGTADLDGTGNGLANRLDGNAGANRLYGGEGNDMLIGGAGADTLIGGLGADRMVGGADDDTYVVDDVGDVIVERAGGGYDRVVAALDWTLGSELERLSLSGTADLKATGNELANRLDGNAGANVLEGGQGNDALYGGAGNDIASYAGATAGVAVNLTTGRASGGDGVDTLDSIEGVWGSAFNDSLTGDASANGLEGFDGSDRLNGRAGDDSLDGGLGADSALYVNASAAVVVDLAAGTATGGDGNDTLSNIENLYGSSFGDTLSGDGGVNVLSGGDGNDLLVGAAGNDRLKGEAGNDRLMGGAGEDTLVGGDGFDTLFGGAGGDAFRFEAVAELDDRSARPDCRFRAGPGPHIADKHRRQHGRCRGSVLCLHRERGLQRLGRRIAGRHPRHGNDCSGRCRWQWCSRLPVRDDGSPYAAVVGLPPLDERMPPRAGGRLKLPILG